MTESRSRIKKAFLAAPAQVPLDVLQEELRRRAITPVTAYELPAEGYGILEHVRRGIRDADLVIAVVPRDSPSNIFLEIGMAYGLGKSVLVLVAPSLELPTDISGQLIVRADPDNRQAIAFALDQLLASRGNRPHRATKAESTERPLGHDAQRYLSKLRSKGDDLSGRELEDLVVEALRASGLTAVTQRSGSRLGADIAVWSDDLQPVVDNPLIIEVKSRIRTKQQLRHAFTQVDTYRRKSNSQWALLLVALASPKLAVTSSGCVLALPVTEFFKRLRDKSFSETVRELRNAHVHGANK